MSNDMAEAGTPSGTGAATANARRAQVAPFLAAGLSVRAISANTGIPVGAVHRVKRRLEKSIAGDAQGAQRATPPEPARNYVVRRVVDDVCADVRRLTIDVLERRVSEAIGRKLLERRDDPGDVLSALFASCLATQQFTGCTDTGGWSGVIAAKPRRSSTRSIN